MEAEIRSNRIVAVIWPVSTRTFHNPDHVIFLLITVMTRAPREPAAPASVGVNQPVYIPPSTIKIRIKIGKIMTLTCQKVREVVSSFLSGLAGRL